MAACLGDFRSVPTEYGAMEGAMGGMLFFLALEGAVSWKKARPCVDRELVEKYLFVQ
jgi:hypothetical protein